jgi:high-affinity Fe2+/Pb2+ permease
MPVLVKLLVWAFLCAAGAAAALVATIAFILYLSAVAKHEREVLRGALVSLVVAMLLWGLVWTIPVPRLMTALERFT